MRNRDEMDCVEQFAAPLRGHEAADPTFDLRLQAAVRSAIERGDVPWYEAGTAKRGLRIDRSPESRPTPVRQRFTARRPFAISPLAGLAAAAGFVVIVAGATLAMSSGDGSPATIVAEVSNSTPAKGSNTTRATVGDLVRFVIAAPEAGTVTVVGDFNGWNAEATPLRATSNDGVWTVALPLAAGSYQYAFVIDGTAWVADPAAPLALEDEFGVSSSLMIVQGGRT